MPLSVVPFVVFFLACCLLMARFYIQAFAQLQAKEACQSGRQPPTPPHHHIPPCRSLPDDDLLAWCPRCAPTSSAALYLDQDGAIKTSTRLFYNSLTLVRATYTQRMMLLTCWVSLEGLTG